MDRLAIWDGTLPFLVSLCFVLSPLLVRHLNQRVANLRRRVANRSVRPFDLSAFHALMERDDETFLREKLSRAEFFRLKRLRIRVMWKYVRCIANNAVTVKRAAASARYHPDVNILQAAKRAQIASQSPVDVANVPPISGGTPMSVHGMMR